MPEIDFVGHAEVHLMHVCSMGCAMHDTHKDSTCPCLARNNAGITSANDNALVPLDPIGSEPW